MSVFLQIIPSHGDLDPHLIHASLGPPESTTRTASTILDQFSRFCTAHVRVLSSMPEYAITPQNCPFSWGNLDPIYVVPWVHSNQHPKRYLDPFSRFTGLCDRQTDRQTTLTISRI